MVAPTRARAGLLARIGSGAGAQTFLQSLGLVQAVALFPLFIAAWGPATYGHWLALTALVAYLGLTDLGAQSYFANVLAMAYAKGDLEGFRRRLSEGVSLYLLLGAGVWLLVVALVVAAATLPGEGRLATADAWIVVLLSAQILLLAVPGGIFATAYRASGQFARGALLGSAIRLFGIAAFAVILLLGVEPPTFAAAILAIGVVHTLLVVLDARRHVRGVRGFALGIVEARAARSSLGGSMLFWIMSVAQAMAQQGVIIVLAVVASPTAVAAYAAHRTMANIAAYAPLVVQAPVLPEMSHLWAQERLAELQRLALGAVRPLVLVAAALGALIAIAAPAVFPTFTAGEIPLQPHVLGLMLGHAVVTSFWTTSSWSLLASNRHRPVAYWALANAVTAVGLSIPLAMWYGVAGVAFAMLAADVLCGLLPVPAQSAIALRLRGGALYAELLRTLPLLVTIAVVGALISGWVIAAVAPGADR